MDADSTSSESTGSAGDAWARDLTARIDSGEANVNDLGRLALRLADLGEHDEAARVFDRIPLDAAAHKTVAERLGLRPVTVPAHSGALGDALAHAVRPRSLVVVVAASVVPTALALLASLAPGAAAAFTWLLLASASLVVVWPALEHVAQHPRDPVPRLRDVRAVIGRHARAHLGCVAATVGPALVTGLVLPGAGMLLLVAGLGGFAALALTPGGDLLARLGALGDLRRRASEEVWLAASTGALWGMSALAGVLLARTGALGIASASLLFFLCASLCARLAACGRLRIATTA